MSKSLNQARTFVCAMLAFVIGTAIAHAQSSGCFSVPAGAGWVNKSFTPVSESFTVIFSATPGAAGAQIDTVMGLSNTRQTTASDFTGSAVLVRFNATGKIDARNGGMY